MSKTFKKSYNKTNQFKSNRFSGYHHFKMKPFGMRGFNYYWQKIRDKFGNIEMCEDVCTEINKTSYRMKLKRNLQNLLDA